jgi:hypothetical protein
VTDKPLTLSDSDISSESSVSRRSAMSTLIKGAIGLGSAAAVLVVGMETPADARYYYRRSDRCRRRYRDRDPYDRRTRLRCDRD